MPPADRSIQSSPPSTRESCPELPTKEACHKPPSVATGCHCNGCCSSQRRDLDTSRQPGDSLLFGPSHSLLKPPQATFPATWQAGLKHARLAVLTARAPRTAARQGDRSGDAGGDASAASHWFPSLSVFTPHKADEFIRMCDTLLDLLNRHAVSRHKVKVMEWDGPSISLL